MRAIEVRRWQMFERVKEFGEAHRELFPESTVGGQAFATVATTAARLNGHAVSRMSALREGRRARTTAREALVVRLQIMARTARVIAVADAASSHFDRFRLPARPTDHSILMTGRLFARDAAPCAAQFTAYGMPATFLADLNERIEAFEQAIRAHDARRRGRAATRVGIASALSSGFAAVRTLDIIVANQLQGDRVMLDAWERVRRVGYPQRKRQPGRGSSGITIARLPRTA